MRQNPKLKKMTKMTIHRFSEDQITAMLDYIRVQLESATLESQDPNDVDLMERTKGELLKGIDDTIQGYVTIND